MQKLKFEIDVTWRFIKNDIWATIIPGLLVSISALSHVQPEPLNIAASIVKSIVFFILYVYTFTLVNQINSEEEDQINKPYRPLPRHLISVSSVKKRILISFIVFILVGFLLQITQWVLLWIIVNLFHNILGHKHWFTKNLISMSFGIFAMIGAGWEIVYPMGRSELIWSILVSFTFGCLGVIQDLRDIDGDRESGRKTLPIAIGYKKSRIVSIILVGISIILFYLVIFIPNLKNIFGLIFALISTILSLIIIYRLAKLEGKVNDHITYMFLLYLFCITLLGGSVFT